jgi:glycosyltransferase involved in cell wall biosynthesis
MVNRSFLFLVANTPWVYALAEAIARDFPTHVTRSYDWLNYRRLKPQWPSSFIPPFLQRTMQLLPPGYAGRLGTIFYPYLNRKVKHWYRILEQDSGTTPWIFVPYPFSAPWVRQISSERLIYYNLDEYIYYQPSRKEQILRQEAELVNRAKIILCIAQFQVEVLRQRYPHRADSIYHFPLGVVESYLNPQPERLPEPMTVGYIGNLIERVDWQLVLQIAQACPDITFIFVGGLDGFAGDVNREAWKVTRQAVLSLPNVRHINKVPQEQVTQYYWSFAINWMPYDITHPFNRAACPTKVMDSIATGRPILSTDVPECRLYPKWINVFHSPEEAVTLIRQQLSSSGTQDAYYKSTEQLKFAEQQTWQARARTLVKLLAQYER